jgi:D-arabinose 1-dehydrogenase-like Zn-dependent alcohol dehydrogenase
VVIRVRACGVCFHDVLVTRGTLKRGIKPNIVLGHEISGEVAQCGANAHRFKPGDRVVSILTECCGACDRCLSGHEHRCREGRGIGHSVDGGYAEYVRITERSLRLLPAGVSFEQGAVAACPIGVALAAIGDLAQPRPGETALVTGAGGGVGVHALLLLKHFGARVFAVTTTEDKASRLRDLGADEVLLSPAQDFQWEVLALTGENGVDVVIDTVGSNAFPAAFQALAQFGRIVFIGQIGAGEISFSPASLLFKDARLLGASGCNFKDLDAALRLIQEGKIKPVVQTFPLAAAANVHQMMFSRRVFGRAVLTP